MMRSQLLIWIWLLLPTVGLAQPIGYSDYFGILREFDLTSGDLIASHDLPGFSGVGAMTMLPDGTFLAIRSGTEVWRFDLTDDSASLIGPLGIGPDRGAGLTLDACGTLWFATGTRLYTVDMSTGTASFVHDLTDEVKALTSFGTTLLGLVGPNGRRLGTIDPVTGVVVAYGDSAVADGSNKGLDFDSDGRLWAVSAAGGNPPIGYHTIVEYEPVSGAILRELDLGAVSSLITGNLAIAPPRGSCQDLAEIPISPVALWLLGIVLGIAGALWSRGT